MIETNTGSISTIEILEHFKFGDKSLGMRRLVDAAITTQDYEIFKQTIAAQEQFESTTDFEQFEAQIAQPLLLKIENCLREKNFTEKYLTLRAENISKKYRYGAFTLSPISLELYTGNITGLVGENGNGKTTLLRLLIGELKPDTGSVKYYFSPNDSGSSFNYDVKTKLSFVSQRPDPWYGLLSDNLQFVATHSGFYGERNYLWTQIVLARMGLLKFKNYTWNQISSGYRMRFELAKALIKKPTILILDEPLANLDILAQQLVLDDLKYLSQSPVLPMSIILSSQQLYEVEKVASQIIFLKNGKPTISQNSKLVTANKEFEANHTIVEIETDASRETLINCFGSQTIDKISFNGGVYMIQFKDVISAQTLFDNMAKSNINIFYYRDITNSSRRFFNN